MTSVAALKSSALPLQRLLDVLHLQYSPLSAQCTPQQKKRGTRRRDTRGMALDANASMPPLELAPPPPAAAAAIAALAAAPAGRPPYEAYIPSFQHWVDLCNMGAAAAATPGQFLKLQVDGATVGYLRPA